MNIDLMQGESIEQMKRLKDNSIDFVLIDLPYKLENHGGGKKEFNGRKLIKN